MYFMLGFDRVVGEYTFPDSALLEIPDSEFVTDSGDMDMDALGLIFDDFLSSLFEDPVRELIDGRVTYWDSTRGQAVRSICWVQVPDNDAAVLRRYFPVMSYIGDSA